MLNTFPQLLVFGFFAPTLLRLVAAGIFLYTAHYHFKHREQITHTRFPIVGARAWVAWVALLVEALVGLGLLVGYYTQIAALVGAIIALKQLVWHSRYPGFFFFSRSTSLLLLVVMLSLLLTGAGAWAMDVPL